MSARNPIFMCLFVSFQSAWPGVKTFFKNISVIQPLTYLLENISAIKNKKKSRGRTKAKVFVVFLPTVNFPQQRYIWIG